MYSWVKLLIRQWSWNNDRISLAIDLALSFIFSLILVFDSDKDVPFFVRFTTFAVIAVYVTAFWHTLKLIVFAPVCIFVSWSARKGEEKAIEMYNDMWDWRQ